MRFCLGELLTASSWFMILIRIVIQVVIPLWKAICVELCLYTPPNKHATLKRGSANSTILCRGVSCLTGGW